MLIWGEGGLPPQCSGLSTVQQKAVAVVLSLVGRHILRDALFPVEEEQEA